MSLHTGLKEGGKEYPLNEIGLLHISGGLLTIFLLSGKRCEEWCSLAEAARTFSRHNIEMFAPNCTMLISHSIIKRISKKGRVELSDEFLQKFPADKKKLFDNICMTKTARKKYKMSNVSSPPLVQPPAAQGTEELFSQWSCSAEWARGKKLCYIYVKES